MGTLSRVYGTGGRWSLRSPTFAPPHYILTNNLSDLTTDDNATLRAQGSHCLRPPSSTSHLPHQGLIQIETHPAVTDHTNLFNVYYLTTYMFKENRYTRIANTIAAVMSG